MITAKREWATAFAKSFVADMRRHPDIAQTARELREKVIRDLTREAKRKPGPVLFPNLRAFLRTTMNIEGARLASGMGEMGEWTEIFTAVTDAASSYFSQREKSKTEAKIAEIKLRAEQAKLAREKAAQEREALARAEGVPGAAPGVPERKDDGIPGWVWIPAAAVGAAVVTKVAGVW